MIQFNIGGELLELPSNIKLQFSKKNILFAFDEIECERSMSFDIQATPKNNRIFSFSRNVATYGDGMRHKYIAQMRNGLVTKNGYLYVDSYGKNVYKAIFVTGELLGLKAIKEAGKMADYLTPLDYILTSDGIIEDNTVNWGRYHYLANADGEVKPSVKLQYLINMCASHFGVNVQTDAYLATLRIAKGSPVKISEIPPSVEHLTFTGRWRGSSENPVNNCSVNDETYARVSTDTADQYVYISGTPFGRWELADSWPVKVFETASLLGLMVEFPANFPNDVFVYIGGVPKMDHMDTDNFLGGYGFDNSGTVFGTPLAGRELTIPNGKFMFVKRADWINDNSTPGRIYRGMNLGDGQTHFNFDFTFNIETDYPVIEDGYMRLVDNMPDISFIELMKANAAIIGKMLNYTDAGGFVYEDLNFAAWDRMELRDVISISEVKRTFANYAQHNLVAFNSEDYVLVYKRYDKKIMRGKLITDYTIINDNIDKQKDLLQIPYTEGHKSYFEPLDVFSDDVEEDDGNSTDMVFAGGTRLGKYVQLAKNNGLQQLCTASTSIKVDARMTQMQFEQIKPKTVIWYAGVSYVWTEANWSDNVATIKLSKI